MSTRSGIEQVVIQRKHLERKRSGIRVLTNYGRQGEAELLGDIWEQDASVFAFDEGLDGAELISGEAEFLELGSKRGESGILGELLETLRGEDGQRRGVDEVVGEVEVLERRVGSKCFREGGDAGA